jgi:RNA polymerase sigma-32 factor
MEISFAAAASAPLLDAESERALLSEWQSAGDRAALERLVLSHLRIVFTTVRPFGCSRINQEELVAEGVFGLIKSAEMFDLSREVRFSTYARFWVKNRVLSAYRRILSVVEVPENERLSGGSQVQGEEIFDHLACEAPTPEEQLITAAAQDRLRAEVAAALAELSPQERRVVEARALAARPESVGDLAAELGLSNSKLRQIERRALVRLKQALLARGITTSRLN